MKKRHKKILAVLLGAATAVSLAAPAFAEGEAMSDFCTEEMAQETEEAGTYTLTLTDTEHGSMFFYEEEDCRKKNFLPGESVLLAAVPEEGYALCSAALAYGESYEELLQNEEGFFEMTMPEADAAVEADFEKAGPVPEEELFSDESEGTETDTEAVLFAAASEEALEEAPEEQDEPGIDMESLISEEDPEEKGKTEEAETEEPEADAGSKELETSEDTEKTEGPETAEEAEGPKEKEEKEETAHDPAASSRLLVRTDDASILDEEAVIGVMDGVYLLQFSSKEEAGEALASYEKEAEFVAEDVTVVASGFGEFETGDPNAEVVMTEEDNPFAEAEQSQAVPVPGSVIALIDTGVSGAKEVTGRYSVLGDDGYDGNGHGDSMLDTIRGFHPKAAVVSIKALDDSGIGTVSSLYAAIRMAIGMQASVINLSLSACSTEENEAISSIIREAVSNGAIVVGAAGNNGSDAGNCIPANIPEAVIAAACNKAGQRLPSSNYGSTVDLFVLAGSSSYAAATLSGIISATGGIPTPDGMAVFAPSGAVAASDYVDGLCYDASGNFLAAGTSYTVHNAGGNRLTDLIPSLTYDSLKAWLGSHENDSYYLGTPYPERVVNGIPQYILGRNGDCDNRNPNGDCGDIHGNDDYAGVAMMNCTGFVWHALWKASGLSYTEGINKIPAWGGIGAGSWKSFIQNNHLEYMTVKSGGTNEINEMLATAMYSAVGPDGKIFLEKGDIIWFWVDQIPLGADDLPVNGYFGGLADKAHVGIYWPETDENSNRWWDSIGFCEYEGESGYYLQNMLHHFTPKTGSVAMTIIKLGYNQPSLTRINVKKTSANTIMTDGNACYSFEGAKYAVYSSQADADAKTNPVTTFTTDAAGYGESEEVLDAGETYYVREIEAPSGGSYRIDPAVYPVETVEPDLVTEESALKVSEMPANDPAYLAIEKISSSGIPAAEGKPLAGTQFTIRYYKGEYADLSSLPDPEKTWVIEAKQQADGAYRAYLLPDYKVSGDDFYFLSGNPDPVLPLGTVTIEETKAAEGYLLENTWKNGSTSGSGVYLAVIRKQGDAVCLTYGNTVIAEDGFTASDTPVRGGVRIQKLDGDMKLDMGEPYAEGDKSLAGAEFTVTSRNDYTVRNKDGKEVASGGAMQVVKTDENGIAQTGAHDLPYGTYEITETKPSQGYRLNSAWKKTFSIREDGEVVELTGEADACYEPDIKGGVRIQKLDADMKLEMGEPYAEGDKSLAGAEFTIFNKSAHAVKNKDGQTAEKDAAVQVIKTGPDGIAQTGNTDLPYGTYEIRETKPSEGYRLNSDWIRTFSIREDGAMTEFVTEDDACYEPDIKGGVQVQKTDLELGKPEALGDGSLAGITYQVINASQHAARNRDGEIVAAGDVMQEITTDAAGTAKTGTSDLPYGTYVLHEITVDDLALSANDSYLAKGAEDITFSIREDGELVTMDTEGKEIVFANQVKRNDLSFRKVEEGTDRPMANIPFMIESAATGEKHVVATDGNGMFSSTKYAHSRSTNANDSILDSVSEESVIREEDLDYKAGVWFGLGQNGSMAEARDDLPAFPYGKYTITELPCETNAGYELIENYPFVIEEDASETNGESLSLNNLHNIPILPEIRTMALDDRTTDHVMCAETEASLTDLVNVKNLAAGKQYMLCATLMDAETDNALRIPDDSGARSKVTGETVFTAERETMSVPVPVSLNAERLAGKTFVVFEQLYLMEEDGSKTPLAEHKEITDEEQTLTVPEIRTAFTDTESASQIGTISREQNVEDTVQYAGLLPGREVSITATVMTADENGNPVELKDENGEVFTKTLTFIPEKSEGSVKVELVIDSRLLAGRKAVCFEEIRYGDAPVAIHADISDRDQTIWYPEIRTTAQDKTTGEHVAAISEKGAFIDTVSYSGLKPGETYTAKAVLMDAETGEPLTEDGKEVTAEKTFTPEKDAGEIAVEIPVDTKALTGRRTVVFEELFICTEDGETKVAEHKDLEDEGQMVRIPEIRTSLIDDASGSHSGSRGRKITLTDTVTYKDLLPGKTYRLSAVLMTEEGGKETELLDEDEKPYTAEKTFTAGQADGSETVSFTVDSRPLAEKKAVCFETLYLEDVKLIVHADITDPDQTVTFPSIRTCALDAVSGMHLATAGGTVIKDTIAYTGLVPGASYIAKGTLMDAGTGKPISAGFLKKVTGETEFVPEKAEGTVEVSFGVDTAALAGSTAVAFEEVFLKTESGKEIPVAEHKDLSDTEQQVRIPEIRTSASVGGKKECTAGKDTELIDTVTYRNLIPFETYVLKGSLVDKESGQPISMNGKPIAAEASFTPVSERGTQEVAFVFDSSLLAGKTVVVFEDLFLTNGEGREVRIASHADVNDAEQSVKIESLDKPGTTATPAPGVTKTPLKATTVTSSLTGDPGRWKWYILLLAGAAAAVTGLVIIKKKKKS